jgi:hypothetical protein
MEMKDGERKACDNDRRRGRVQADRKSAFYPEQQRRKVNT